MAPTHGLANKGDPFQVWKWPGIIAIGIWAYLLGAGDAKAIGFATGTVIGFLIGQLAVAWLFRKIVGELKTPWWVFAIPWTVAGLLSFSAVSTSTTGAPNFSAAFFIIYVVGLLPLWFLWLILNVVSKRVNLAEPA